MAKRGPKSPLTDHHKAALAQGRNEGRAVRSYLEALRGNKPKRGRKRTSDSINKQLKAIDEQLKTADPVTELRLVQKRRDLNGRARRNAARMSTSSRSRTTFVKVVASYSERQGISWASWREVGVPASVLTRAGLSRQP